MNKKVQKILDKIGKLSQELVEERNRCPHTNKDVKHKSNIDYPYEGYRAWTDFKCNDCGKRWEEDGHK